MLDVKKCIKDELFFSGGEESLSKSLTPGETFLGSDMFSRVYPRKVIIFYLNSSDQVEIPGKYINLFQILNTRVGDRFRGNVPGSDLESFISLGIELPGMLLHKTDPRGIRNIICKMVILGTSGIRDILPSLEPWILSNINSTVEI